MRRRHLVNKLIGGRNIKIAFMAQSVITTLAIVFMMLQTTSLDQISRLDLHESTEDVLRCRGCCAIHNDSLRAILNEPYLSEKLHKFSRAVRKYDIPQNILNILHEAEHKIEMLEKELLELKHGKEIRFEQLQGDLIEVDISKGRTLTPNRKPKSKKPPVKSQPSNSKSTRKMEATKQQPSNSKSTRKMEAPKQQPSNSKSTAGKLLKTSNKQPPKSTNDKSAGKLKR